MKTISILNKNNTYCLYKSNDIYEVAFIESYVDALENKEFLKAVSKKGLVPVQRLVQRKGKTFRQTLWVKPEDAKKRSASKDIVQDVDKIPDNAKEIKLLDSYTKEDFNELIKNPQNFNDFFKDNKAMFFSIFRLNP